MTADKITVVRILLTAISLPVANLVIKDVKERAIPIAIFFFSESLTF